MTEATNETMAVVAATLKTWKPLEVGATVYLPVDEINVDHEANSRRYSAAKITEMATSLLVNGQLQPVKITSTTRRLGLGYRRTAGIAYINENRLYKADQHPNLEPNSSHGRQITIRRQILIRCEVIPELSERDLFLMNMAENDDREDVTPIDKANQALRLTTPETEGGFGMTQKECADAMSQGGKKVSQSTVSKYLKVLAEAPKWATNLVHEGKRPMETLIECVGYPAGSKDRDTAMDSFKAGESGTKVKAKVREIGGGDEGDDSPKKKTIRSRAELMAAFEAEAYVEEGVQPSPYEEVFQFLVKFAAGKMSAKKLQEQVALRVKKSLPKESAA